MSEIKLLPCPFCGGEFYIDVCGMIYIPKCKKCGCKLAGCRTQEEAIEEANTRKPMEQIVERLEKYKRANDMCRENAASAKRHENVRYFENLIFATEQAISMVKEEGGIE